MTIAFRTQMLLAQRACVLERTYARQPPISRLGASSLVAKAAEFDEATGRESAAAAESYLKYRRWQEARMEEAQAHEGRKDITFARLIEHRARLVKHDNLSSAAFANEKTALARFRACFGLAEQDSVIPWMTHRFGPSLAEFERAAVGTGIDGKKLSTASIAGYLSRLRTFNATALSLLGASETFAQAVDRLVRTWVSEVPGRTIKGLSELSGVDGTLIRSWRNGVRPTESSVPKTRSLESALGIAEGELSGKVIGKDVVESKSNVAKKRARFADDTVVPYLNRIRYVPRFEEMPELMKEFFESIEVYKTGSTPGLADRNCAEVSARSCQSQAFRNGRLTSDFT